jgi:nitrite reductase (NO-forming)
MAGLKLKIIVIVLLLIPFTGLLVFHSAESQKDGSSIKRVLLIASEKEVQVAPDNAIHPGGIRYNAMVFNGTIPGPVIAIDEGDSLLITLRNEGQTVHSLEFHSGFGPSQAVSGSVKPGESKTWVLEGQFPGAFEYYCTGDSLNGIWEHVANGMYGGIVVHPRNEKPAKEFYVAFSELYNNADKGEFNGTNGTGSFDVYKFLSNNPDLVLTNGMAHKYVPAIGQVDKLELNKDAELFKVKPGELTRWYVVNAGPRGDVAFSFLRGMIDVRDGSISNVSPSNAPLTNASPSNAPLTNASPSNAPLTNAPPANAPPANAPLGSYYGLQLKGDETWSIPPGSASVIESIFPEPGVYVGMDQDLGRFVFGGAFAVVALENSTETDHPTGTWVPPRGSSVVSGSPIE